MLKVMEQEQSIPLSALQHHLFCPRQSALIHLERLWQENRFTMEGRVLHETAHDPSASGTDGKGVRLARGLSLSSTRLGLYGVADVVEFHPDGRVVPVEYKRGKPKEHDADRIQLCAQAFCLEEMLSVEIPLGFLFYGQNRRREEVSLDGTLREHTEQIAADLRAMLKSGVTPKAVREPKCDSCSLIDLCLPEAMRYQSVREYNNRLFDHLNENDPS